MGRHPRRQAATGLAIALLVAACNVGPRASMSPSPSPPPTVAAPTPTTGEQLIGTIRISDAGCEFQPGPEPLHEGPARLEAVNDTTGWAGAHLWRILAGTTYEDLAAHVEEERQRADAGQPGLGHPGFVGDLIPVELAAPGIGSASGTLRAGTYGFVCARFSESAREPRPFAAIGPIEVREP